MTVIDSARRTCMLPRQSLRRVVSDRSGTTAIEYAVIAAVLAVAVAASMGVLMPPVSALFNKLIGIFP